MAQLWHYLALSMILGLGSITSTLGHEPPGEIINEPSGEELLINKIFEKFENTSKNVQKFIDTLFAKNNDDTDASDSNRNTPRKDGHCVYYYRSNVIDHCVYYILFGKYAEGDKLVMDKIYEKPSNAQIPLIVEVEFPIEDTTMNYDRVSYIYVEDEETSKKIYDDQLQIKKGGIGETSFKMEIKSNYTVPASYRVAVYVRPAN